MYKLAKEGHSVNVCILSGGVAVRKFRPTTSELNNDLENALELLGVDTITIGDFPNIEFNNTGHLKLVQFIEKAIIESDADIIFTHHPADLNNDHLHSSIACQAAARLFQRRGDIKPLKELLFMEVPSSTEWGLNRGLNHFNPNMFVEIGISGVNKKLEALAQYRGVMRDYPHPRSKEVIEGLAAFRGGQSGMRYAEAFESAFRRGF